MNFLPAILLFSNFSTEETLLTTDYFYNKLKLSDIYQHDFKLCLQLVKQTKELLRESNSLAKLLDREDILDSLLIKWFSGLFCGLMNPSEVRFFNFLTEILLSVLGVESSTAHLKIRHRYISAADSCYPRVSQKGIFLAWWPSPVLYDINEER